MVESRSRGGGPGQTAFGLPDGVTERAMFSLVQFVLLRALVDSFWGFDS